MFKKNYNIKPHVYFRTGGRVAYFYEPQNLSELESSLKKITESEAPMFILGAGSNSLVSDSSWSGAVLSLHKMQSLEFDSGEQVLYLGAGVENSWAVEKALSLGLAGIGWMNNLPGQIGATVRMNARCYGGEISQVASQIVAFERNGTRVEYFVCDESRLSVFRGYKNTVFMENGQIIGQVGLKLTFANQDKIDVEKALAEKCKIDRMQKDQFSFPSCGCVFKNNYSPEISISSGFLLEQAGAKELSCGGANVHPKHANFVQNRQASSDEILNLTFMMQDLVYEKFGVWLEYEMEFLGFFPKSTLERIQLRKVHNFEQNVLNSLRAKFQQRFE